MNPENTEVFQALIQFVILTTEYYTKIKPSIDNKKMNKEEFTIHDRTMMTEEIQKITQNIKKFLLPLYASGIIPLEKALFQVKFKKMSSFIKGILDDITGDDIYGDPDIYK